MEKPQNNKPQAQWVKLHLVPQTENTDMPPFALGLLYSETATHYILNPMLEMVENEDNYEHQLVDVGMNAINKTYVWRCQILQTNPLNTIDTQSSEVETGGLG